MCDQFRNRWFAIYRRKDLDNVVHVPLLGPLQSRAIPVLDGHDVRVSPGLHEVLDLVKKMNQKSEGRVHPTTQQEKEVLAQFHADKEGKLVCAPKDAQVVAACPAYLERFNGGGPFLDTSAPTERHSLTSKLQSTGASPQPGKPNAVSDARRVSGFLSQHACRPGLPSW